MNYWLKRVLFVSFVIWLLLSVVLYCELFLGLHGIITTVSSKCFSMIGENQIISSTNYHMENFNAISNRYKSFMILVGIGGIKCGSTYFHKSLTKYGKKQNSVNQKYKFLFGPRNELHFERCTNCTFENYMELHLSNVKNRKILQNETKTWIFGEKTPRYFDSYKAINLLTFFGHTNNMYFYVLLRNPVKQIWSHIWMRTNLCNSKSKKNIKLRCYFIRKENSNLNASNINDIKQMSIYLIDFIENQINKQLPLVSTLMNTLKIDYNSSGGHNNNDDMDKIEIIELLKQISYDRLHYYSHVFIQSTHYVLILMWYQLWNQWNNIKSIQFEDRFRIIQSHHLFNKHSLNTEMYITTLICWILGYQINKIHHCKSNELMLFKNPINFRKTKIRSYSPKIVDVMQITDVVNAIQSFYNDSQQRLIWFIRKHPKLMLGGTQFVRWW